MKRRGRTMWFKWEYTLGSEYRLGGGFFFYSISLHANANAMDLLWGEVNNILLYFLLYILDLL